MKGELSRKPESAEPREGSRQSSPVEGANLKCQARGKVRDGAAKGDAVGTVEVTLGGDEQQWSSSNTTDAERECRIASRAAHSRLSFSLSFFFCVFFLNGS